MQPHSSGSTVSTSRWRQFSPGLQAMWMLWMLLLVLLLVTTGLFQLSVRTVQLPITLTTGQSAEITVWRPWAHPCSFALRFARLPGQSRPELGEWVTPAVPAQGVAVPSLVFSRPGEPVKILVETSDQQAPYAAMPASSSDGSAIDRPMVPWAESVAPGEFTWPAVTQTHIAQATGPSHYRFTVQEVGPHLQGEQVQLLLLAPLSFKTAQPGYGWLWALFFWPSFAAVLAVAGVVLLWLSHRHIQRSQPPEDLQQSV
ncbi:MAG: hypothetical protein LBE30_08010 [Comamonas sp.]|nr:hypothetical protein [Comamonas sp.]